MKDGKMIQVLFFISFFLEVLFVCLLDKTVSISSSKKLMIDETKCYFFGRNKDQCEFVIDHASCSRVHAVLLWHKHLNRSFLIDLNSSTFTFAQNSFLMIYFF